MTNVRLDRQELINVEDLEFVAECRETEERAAFTMADLYGWDYPPKIGYFGMLALRTCGSCQLKDTLFWKVNTNKKIPIPIVVEGVLTAEEFLTWERIKGEPESLLDEE